MHIVPFQAEHARTIALQHAQAVVDMGRNSFEDAALLERYGGGFTAIDNGQVIACAGLAEQWQGRMLAWAMLAGDIGPHRFVRVTRAIRRALDLAQCDRIEMQVDADHPQAIRWAQTLGFEVESRMRRFLPDGRDAFMFVRIR